MRYAVSQEGVAALNTMASAITESVDRIQSYHKTVMAVADEHQDALGPHKASLDAALSDIAESVKQASEPANSVAASLIEVAEGYEEIISNNGYRDIAGK